MSVRRSSRWGLAVVFTVMLVIVPIIEAFSAGNSNPPKNLAIDETQDDMYNKCIGEMYPNLKFFGFKPDGTQAIPDQPSTPPTIESYDYCGAGITPREWYGCLGQLSNGPAVQFDQPDVKTYNFVQNFYPGDYSQTRYTKQPGRFCVKYFGAPDPDEELHSPYNTSHDYATSQIWYDYCEDLSLGFDSIGISSSCRKNRPSAIYRLLLKRVGTSALNTSYIVNSYSCSFWSLTDPASCQYSLFGDDWAGMFHGTHMPWLAMGGDVTFYYNDIQNMAANSPDGGYGSMPSGKGKGDMGGNEFCLVRVPPGYLYPGANLFNLDVPYKKVGRNYNLNINESFYDNTLYATGQRNEICAYLLESQSPIDNSNLCNSPYLAFPDFTDTKDYKRKGPGNIVSGSFFGCVQEPMLPSPSSFNPYVFQAPTPSISSVIGSFINTKVIVSNNIEQGNRDGFIPVAVTLNAPFGVYPTNGNTYDGQCEIISTGVPNGLSTSYPKYFANPTNNTVEAICALVPVEMADQVCICYQSECTAKNYIACSGSYKRPPLVRNGTVEYKLDYTWDDDYGHGITIQFANDDGSFNTIVPPYQANTIFETIYNYQLATLTAIRSKTQLPPNMAIPSGFSNDKIPPEKFYGLDAYTVIPYIDKSQDKDNTQPTLQAIYTPNYPLNATLIDGTQTCLKYETNGAPSNTTTNYEWFVLPAGMRDRSNANNSQQNNQVGLDRISQQICVGSGASCESPGEAIYTLPISDNYCRSSGYATTWKSPPPCTATGGKVYPDCCPADKTISSNPKCYPPQVPPVAIGDPYNCPIPMERIYFNSSVSNLDTCITWAKPPQCQPGQQYPACCPSTATQDVNPNCYQPNCQCQHESSRDVTNTNRLSTALEVVFPGIYLNSAKDEKNNQICIFTENPLTYYFFTGLLMPEERKAGGANLQPIMIGCVPLPPEVCKPIETPSSDSALLTWQETVSPPNPPSSNPVSELSSCPIGVDNSYFDPMTKSIYTLILEPQKNYFLTLKSCKGDCANAFNQAQLLLQQSYNSNCKTLRGIDSAGYTPFWSYGQVDVNPPLQTNLVPDCKLSVDPATVTQINNLLEKYKTIVQLDTLANTTFASNDPSKVAGMLFTPMGNGEYTDTFGSFKSSGSSNSLVEGDFYYFNFPGDCNNPLGSNACSISQIYKAQKYLYLFLATKDDTRNLTLAEENFIRLALRSYLDPASIPSGDNPTPTIALNSQLMANVTVDLTVVPTQSITRTCNSGQNVFTDSNNNNITASCKINAAIEMCPPLANTASPIISGYAKWPGFSFWDKMPPSFAYSKFDFNQVINNPLPVNGSQVTTLGTDISLLPRYEFYRSTNSMADISSGITPNLWNGTYPVRGTAKDDAFKNLDSINTAIANPFWYPLILSINLLNGQSIAKSDANAGYDSVSYLYEPELRLGYVDYYIRGTCTNTTKPTPVQSPSLLDMSQADNSAAKVTDPVRACRVYFMPTQPNQGLDSPISVIGAHWMPVINPCTP